ncbi:MAG: GGDEF domain-containing protein [Deltaproteobacteria bacterium]|nr:GGDEF domain-containing protein [Deltaproteobacteria bacterium]
MPEDRHPVKISALQMLKAPGRKSDLVMAGVLILIFIFFEFSDRTIGDAVEHTVVAVGFLWIYLRYVKPSDYAVDRLADTLREHGSALPGNSADPLSAAEAVKNRLDRYAVELSEQSREQQAAKDRRVEDLSKAHRDLLTHHKCTKKMLQSFRIDEVFETLLSGVRDGLEFRGAILGTVDRDGVLTFHDDTDLEGRKLTRIPSWNERSLLARTLWGGNSLICQGLDEHPHTAEDLGLLGTGPFYLFSILRKQSATCAEIKSCGNVDCSAYLSAEARCWVEHSQDCSIKFELPAEEKRKACVACELFAPAALMAVRTVPDSRKVDRDSIVPVVTLANEAAMALHLVDMHENLQRMSITDGLTGLFNHREFYQQLHRELERARRYRHTVSLLIIDVDDFKLFNDRFGHLAGDLALRKISDLLRQCARATDIVARYGGEEFAVILPESTASGALMLAERIKTEVANHNFLPQVPGEVHLTVSIGIYSAEEGAVTEDQLVSYADEAAYSAKHSGKNCVVMKTHA